MDTGESVVVVLVAVWLLVLTIVWFVQVRQVGLLTLSVAGRGGSLSTNDKKLLVNGPVPEAMEPDCAALAEGDGYFVWLSSDCLSCQDIAVELGDSWAAGQQGRMKDRVVVLLSGSGERHDAIRRVLPSDVRVIGDPRATELGQKVGVPATPFAVAIRKERTVGWTSLRSLEDLTRLDRANEPRADNEEEALR